MEVTFREVPLRLLPFFGILRTTIQPTRLENKESEARVTTAYPERELLLEGLGGI